MVQQHYTNREMQSKLPNKSIRTNCPINPLLAKTSLVPLAEWRTREKETWIFGVSDSPRAFNCAAVVWSFKLKKLNRSVFLWVLILQSIWTVFLWARISWCWGIREMQWWLGVRPCRCVKHVNKIECTGSIWIGVKFGFRAGAARIFVLRDSDFAGFVKPVHGVSLFLASERNQAHFL